MQKMNLTNSEMKRKKILFVIYSAYGGGDALKGEEKEHERKRF